ncbi:MAG: hypothetical protein IJK52_02750 [Oscillospiraceae bacterium]|nr:hypothetical protein [Oscillospiraceae bacterium]
MDKLNIWNKLSPFTKAAFKRALKTVAQTAVALLLTHDRVSGVDWGNIVDVAAMSGLLSILTSVSAGVPESPLQLQEGNGSTEQPLHVQEGGGPDEHY